MKAIILGITLSTAFEFISLFPLWGLLSFNFKKLWERLDLRLMGLRWIILSILLSFFSWLMFSLTTWYPSEILGGISVLLLVAIIPSYSFILEPFYLLLFAPKEKDQEIEHWQNWVNTVQPNKISVVLLNKEINNLYATGILPFGKIILIGKPILKELEESEIQSFLMHEIGHLKENHLLILYVVNLLAAFLCVILHLLFAPPHEAGALINVAFGTVVGVSCMLIIPSLLQRFLEYRADRFAAQRVGQATYVQALNKLNEVSKGMMEKWALNYPRLHQRIAHVRKHT